MSKNKKQKKGYFRRYFFYDIHKTIGIWLWFIFFRPKRILINDNATKHFKGGALVCLNHHCFSDVPYIQLTYPFRRHHIVTGEATVRNPFIAWLLKMLLALPIDRNNFSYSSFRNIVNTLKDGRIVDIFCEGHMNKDYTKIDPVKEGAVLMAYTAKVPIIPIYMRTRCSKLERLRIGIGEPIYLDQLGYNAKENMGQVANLIHDKLEELMHLVDEDYYKHHPKKRG